MARNWIVVGDITSSGGRVITGSPFTDIDGIPVSRVSDKATCPKHKGVFPIVDGDVTMIVDSQPVALHGSSLACGCKVLTAQQNHVFVDPGSGAGGRAGSAQSAAVAATAVAITTAAKSAAYRSDSSESVECDEAICFLSESGAPLAGVNYTLHLASGETCGGVTDENGLTERVATSKPELIIKAVLIPPAGTGSCCALDSLDPGETVLELEGVATNVVDLGQSVVEVRAKEHKRDLTPGELDIARQGFATRWITRRSRSTTMGIGCCLVFRTSGLLSRLTGICTTRSPYTKRTFQR